METIARRLGLQLTHVPYKGVPTVDLMAGIVDLQLEASTTALPNIKAGKIKALATSGRERIPALPDLPTLTEVRADLDPDGATGNSWHGVFAPAGTPDAIVARLSTEIVNIVKKQDMQDRLRELGLTPTGMPSESLAKAVATDYDYWGKIVRDLGIKVDRRVARPDGLDNLRLPQRRYRPRTLAQRHQFRRADQRIEPVEVEHAILPRQGRPVLAQAGVVALQHLRDGACSAAGKDGDAEAALLQRRDGSIGVLPPSTRLTRRGTRPAKRRQAASIWSGDRTASMNNASAPCAR
jgi:hypothetical protein